MRGVAYVENSNNGNQRGKINLALDAHLIGQSVLAFSTIGHHFDFCHNYSLFINSKINGLGRSLRP